MAINSADPGKRPFASPDLSPHNCVEFEAMALDAEGLVRIGKGARLSLTWSTWWGRAEKQRQRSLS